MDRRYYLTFGPLLLLATLVVSTFGLLPLSICGLYFQVECELLPSHASDMLLVQRVY